MVAVDSEAESADDHFFTPNIYLSSRALSCQGNAGARPTKVRLSRRHWPLSNLSMISYAAPSTLRHHSSVSPDRNRD